MLWIIDTAQGGSRDYAGKDIRHSVEIVATIRLRKRVQNDPLIRVIELNTAIKQ